MSGVHLAVVPKAEPQPLPRLLKLRDGLLVIELDGALLSVNLFRHTDGDGSDSRVAYAVYRRGECHLHASSAENRFRLWLDRTALGLSADEFAAMREAFPELDVREINAVGS